jgi:hypothetical protein
MRYSFTLGYIQFINATRQLDCILRSQRRLAGVYELVALDFAFGKELLRACTTRSAPTMITPVDLRH